MDAIKCSNGCGVLENRKTSKGIIWECGECKGRSVAVAVLKKSVPPKLVSSLWVMAREGKSMKGAPCAHCTKDMAKVSVPVGEESASKLLIEVCQICHYLWIEPSQNAMLPGGASYAKPELTSAARQAVALAFTQFDAHVANNRPSVESVGLKEHAAVEVGSALFAFALELFTS